MVLACFEMIRSFELVWYMYLVYYFSFVFSRGSLDSHVAGAFWSVLVPNGKRFWYVAGYLFGLGPFGTEDPIDYNILQRLETTN